MVLIIFFSQKSSQHTDTSTFIPTSTILPDITHISSGKHTSISKPKYNSNEYIFCG